MKKASRLDNDNKRLDVTLKALEGKYGLKEKEANHLQEMNEKVWHRFIEFWIIDE